MKKQLLTLAILLGVAALLTVGILVAKKVSEKEDVTTAAERKLAFSVDVNDITKLEWKYGDRDALTIVKNGDGEWRLTDEPETPLDKARVMTILNGVAQIPVNQEIKGVDSKSCGFDAPTNKVKVTASGKTTEIMFGARSLTGSEYYLLLDGRIYMVDLYENSVFDKVKTDLYRDYDPDAQETAS